MISTRKQFENGKRALNRSYLLPTSGSFYELLAPCYPCSTHRALPPQYKTVFTMPNQPELVQTINSGTFPKKDRKHWRTSQNREDNCVHDCDYRIAGGLNRMVNLPALYVEHLFTIRNTLQYGAAGIQRGNGSAEGIQRVFAEPASRVHLTSANARTAAR